LSFISPKGICANIAHTALDGKSYQIQYFTTGESSNQFDLLFAQKWLEMIEGKEIQ